MTGNSSSVLHSSTRREKVLCSCRCKFGVESCRCAPVATETAFRQVSPVPEIGSDEAGAGDGLLGTAPALDPTDEEGKETE